MGDLFEIGGKQLGGGLDKLEDLGEDLQEGYDEFIEVTTRFYAGDHFFKVYRDNDNDLRTLLQGNVPFSLDPIFNRNSGWPRAIFWAGSFAALYYFIFGLRLIHPVIYSYNERDVSSSFSYQYTPVGVPRPTVTVCPKGDGLRCDCMLFKFQLCRARTKKERKYFDNLVCESQVLDKDPGSLSTLCADDWSPNTLDWANDKCGSDLLRGNTLNERVNERRRRGDAYITKEESILYAGVRLSSENTVVELNNDLFTVPNEKVNSTWINYHYLAVSEGKMCMQISPIDRMNVENMQTQVGSTRGYHIVVNDTIDTYVRSSPTTGVDVYIDYDFEDYQFPLMEIPIPVSSGVVTTIAYEQDVYRRKKGYGDIASQTCLPDGTGDSRNFCNTQSTLANVKKECKDTCTNTSAADFFGINASVVDYAAYGCSFRCYDSVPPVYETYDVCPTLCEVRDGTYTVTTADQNKFGRMKNQNEYGSAGNVVALNIGVSKFVTSELNEDVAMSFSAAVGNIGGSLNLYFGPAFMTVFAYLELVAIGIFLSFKSDIDENEGDNIEDHKLVSEKEEKKGEVEKE